MESIYPLRSEVTLAQLSGLVSCSQKGSLLLGCLEFLEFGKRHKGFSTAKRSPRVIAPMSLRKGAMDELQSVQRSVAGH